MKYYPSNGSEGMMFTEDWCSKCYKEKQCTILINYLEGVEPRQWIYTDGKPTCTSFCNTRPVKKSKDNFKKMWEGEAI